MWTFRKSLITAIIVITVLVLLRSSTSSTAPAPLPLTAQSQQASPNRSYPPPTSPNHSSENQVPVENVAKMSLRERLRYQFPFDLEQKFPAYIWQTWKSSPASGAFEERLRPLEAAWTLKNPGFVHEVIVDEAATSLIKYLYASVPDVIEAYNALPLPVLKADFFRYLILLARGGVYSDIDTEPLQPTTDWLPDNFDQATAGLIIGIEADPDRPDWAKWYSRRIQFCQWTIQSKPGHPVLREVVARITEDTLRMKKEHLLKMGQSPKSIVEFTGPAIWTDAVFAYFNDPTFFDFSERDTNVTYSDFFALTEARKMGDVVILPITSFSPDVGQMGAGDVNDKMAFVRHDFEGTWKPEKDRMRGGG